MVSCTNCRCTSIPPPEDGDEDEREGKNKKAETSKPGDKLRTPESHKGDFTKLGNRQWINKNTGEVWTRERSAKAHRGEYWDVQNGNTGKRVADVRQNGEVLRVNPKGL